jgi:hypothetical protein
MKKKQDGIIPKNKNNENLEVNNIVTDENMVTMYSCPINPNNPFVPHDGTNTYPDDTKWEYTWSTNIPENMILDKNNEIAKKHFALFIDLMGIMQNAKDSSNASVCFVDGAISILTHMMETLDDALYESEDLSEYEIKFKMLNILLESCAESHYVLSLENILELAEHLEDRTFLE